MNWQHPRPSHQRDQRRALMPIGPRDRLSRSWGWSGAACMALLLWAGGYFLWQLAVR